MSDTLSESKACFFFSAHGRLLPRWIEAFPAARAVALAGGGAALPATVAWLHLESGERSGSVADQVELVRSRAGTARMIVLSDMPTDDEAMLAFSAGAAGYCNAHANVALLKQVEQVVLLGGLWVGEGLLQRVVAGIGRLPPLPSSTSAAPAPAWRTLLTERECEVAEAVCSGASNKEVARKLGISERTVKAHMANSFEKLKVRDRLQLALVVKGLSGPANS